MSSCPHCSEAIESLPGFVSQSKLEARLSGLKEGKDAEIAALSARVSEYGAKASGYDAVVAERDSLKTASTARDLRDDRVAILTSRGVDPAHLADLEQVYGWSQNGVAEDAQKDWPTWIAEDAAGNVLSQRIMEGSTGAPPVMHAAPAPVAPRPNLIPPVNGTTPPPPSGAQITPQDVATWMASAAYQNLPSSAEKRAKMAEWQDRISQQG